MRSSAWFRSTGTAADYVAVPATNMCRKPATVDHVAAASVPLSALTAWQALVTHGHVKPGDRALIHGGAGGVGAFAVQIAPLSGDSLDRSYKVVAPGGHVLALNEPPNEERAARHGITAAFFLVEFDSQQLEHLAGLIDRGSLTAPITATFALSDGRAAYESGASGRRKPGKTVIKVR